MISITFQPLGASLPFKPQALSFSVWNSSSLRLHPPEMPFSLGNHWDTTGAWNRGEELITLKRAFPCISGDALFQRCCRLFEKAHTSRIPLSLPFSLKLLWHLPWSAWHDLGLSYSFTSKLVAHLSVLVLFLTFATAHIVGPNFSSPGPCSRPPAPELALRSAAKSFQNASSQPKILECCPTLRPTHCFQTECSQYCQNWVVKKSQKSGLLCEFSHPFCLFLVITFYTLKGLRNIVVSLPPIPGPSLLSRSHPITSFFCSLWDTYTLTRIPSTFLLYRWEPAYLCRYKILKLWRSNKTHLQP